jgi:hypothetical protein
MVLGDSPYWERAAQHRLRIPLSCFRSEIISFTFSDSFYAFSKTTLRGIPIPDAPHRATVFTKHDVERIVDDFGLPPGYADSEEPFDVYIEAQIWDDSPLEAYLRRADWEQTNSAK